jgi:hypothetical protein
VTVNPTAAVTGLVTLAGAVAEGETYSVTVDVTTTVSHLVTAADTRLTVAQDLASQVTAIGGYAGAVSDDPSAGTTTLSITKLAGGSLSVSPSIQTAGSTAVPAPAAPTSLVTLSGSTGFFDTWSLTIDGTYSPSHTSFFFDSISNVARDLAGQVNAIVGYTAQAVDNPNGSSTIIITKLVAGGSLTVTANAGFNGSASVAPLADGSDLVTFSSANGQASSGETYTVTVDGRLFSILAGANQSQLTLAESLAAAVGGVSGYVAVAQYDGAGATTMSITRPAGGFATVTSAILPPGSVSSVTAGLTRLATLGGSVSSGDTWSLTVHDDAGSHLYSYPVQSGDTLANVGQGLASQIDGTAGLAATFDVATSTLVVTQLTGTTLVIESAVPGAAGSVVTYAGKTNLVTMGGLIAFGETWSLTLKDDTGTHSYSHLVLANTETPSSVAQDLASQVSALSGYTAGTKAVTGGTVIAITQVVGGTLNVSTSITGTFGTNAFHWKNAAVTLADQDGSTRGCRRPASS